MIFLIPCPIAENAAETLPNYILESVKNCQVFFVENERTARRFLKTIWKEMVIDDYQWHTIHKAEMEVMQAFEACIKQNKNIGIISEAGCPAVADPGQILIAKAQELKITIKPLVGPSSILLALMASGMNGQRFLFEGYLPIDNLAREKKIKELEDYSAKNNCTIICIETPYRNNPLIESFCKTLSPETQLCIAFELTSPQENIITKKIKDWAIKKPDIHKRPAIFLWLAK